MELVQRKPPIANGVINTVNKRGSCGNVIKDVTSNYFEVLTRPDMCLFQYRVDFSPEIDHTGLKQTLLRNHESLLGKYIFDGTLLYGTTRFPQPMELFTSRRNDDTRIAIRLRLVGEVKKEDANHVNVMNIILRRCLKMLNLTMMKRNYFDSEAAIEIPQHKLTIWPGYLTTIHPHDSNYLLGVEIVHKVLRQDSALNVMERIRRECRTGNVWNEIKAALEGQIVMTH